MAIKPAHKLTYPKGVYSFRYFLQPMRIPNMLMHIFIFPNPFLVCSCMYASLLQLDLNAYTKCTHWVSNCNSQAKCIYAWESNKRNRLEEVPEWVYAFWVCKPVNSDWYNYFFCEWLLVESWWSVGAELFHRTLWSHEEIYPSKPNGQKKVILLVKILKCKSTILHLCIY